MGGGNDDVDCDTRQFGNVDSICCWLGSEGIWKDLSFFIDFLSHDRLLRDRFTLQLEPAKNEMAMANCVRDFLQRPMKFKITVSIAILHDFSVSIKMVNSLL